MLPIYSYFSSSLSVLSEERSLPPDFARKMASDSSLRANLSAALQVADMGISEIVTKPAEVDVAADFPSRLARALTSPQHRLAVLHKTATDAIPLDFENESNGTQAFLALSHQILEALTQRKSICVDEMDSSLHAILVTWLVHRFHDSKTNPKGSQLIFATHDTNLLSSTLLNRGEIWFTEKDSQGASHLYPLSDFKSRPNENVETGYLQGRYGAIPFINSNAFLTAMAKTNCKK